jgi:hypothetical protein
MLRHVCGYKLANDGGDTWSLQAYFGSRQHDQRLEEEFAADNLCMDVEGHIKPYSDFVRVGQNRNSCAN